MFQTKEMVPLFPTTLWSFQIPTDTFGRINTGLRNMLDQLIAAAADQDHKGMWQTEHDLHTLPEMQELTGYFLNAVNDVMGVISTKHNDVEITGCWANISPSGSSHRSHMHANNFLSAVYYVTVPRGGHRITFHDPRVQPRIVVPAVKERNVHNANYVNFEAKEGMLLLFPAWLVHSVPVNTANERRISISFNINFTDFTRQISPASWEPNLSTHPDLLD